MTQLFRLSGGLREAPQVEAWFAGGDAGMRALAQPWLERMLACGPDVRQLLHDGHPTVCVSDAAFAYVDAFGAHVNVGFFHGAELDDPTRLLEGSGKRMRHVKLRWGSPLDAAALQALIAAAYRDIHIRLGAEPQGL